MGEKRTYKARKPGGGRKKQKPEYDAGENMKEQMESAVALYEEGCSLRDIADVLTLNPIKVRKLLIEKISVGAERQRRYRAIRKLRSEPTEEHLWETVLLYSGVRFTTYSGLPFTYEIRKGRNGQYTKELWIDRRENSKSLAWSSVLLARRNMKKVGEVVDRPKALGDIRGVTYIYGMFYRFGLIDVPDKIKEKMGHPCIITYNARSNK